MIGWIVVIVGGLLAVWCAWRGVRGRDRWPAALAASESWVSACLVAVIGNWSEVPWWLWWIVATPALVASTAVAWRWADLGTGRPRWRWPSLVANTVLLVGCVIVAVLPPG